MFGPSRSPRDSFRYAQDSSSRLLTVSETPGTYVYVVDTGDDVYVAPNDSHMHPKVLGQAEAVLYAEEILIESTGVVSEVNNLSGTFRFNSRSSLCCLASKLTDLGFSVEKVVWYLADGTSPPRQLSCP
jgi:hypothetical protein